MSNIDDNNLPGWLRGDLAPPTTPTPMPIVETDDDDDLRSTNGKLLEDHDMSKQLDAVDHEMLESFKLRGATTTEEISRDINWRHTAYRAVARLLDEAPITSEVEGHIMIQGALLAIFHQAKDLGVLNDMLWEDIDHYFHEIQDGTRTIADLEREVEP